MARKVSTHFKPCHGSKYVIINDKTKEEYVCKVLCPKSSDEYGPVRSAKKCVRGEEFFKVIILENQKVVKIMNSILKEPKSDDGEWLFTGQKSEKVVVVPIQKSCDHKREKISVFKKSEFDIVNSQVMSLLH